MAALSEIHAIFLPKLSYGAKNLIRKQAFCFVAHVYRDCFGGIRYRFRRTFANCGCDGTTMNASFFQIRVERESDAWTVSLSGDVDYAASLELAPHLIEIADKCEGSLLFDLGEVTMIDSEGIKALLSVYARVRSKNKSMKVIKCSQPAMRVLHLVGVDEMLGIGMG